ncbi:hypothetical protein C8Q74DRAFT_1451463 [Fomes fomentarius]|nr:hypothetical protein C8Q74DRAFT_1451463 [Fomes fomentarius]
MTSFLFGQPLPRAEDVLNDPGQENCKSLYATMILPAEDAAVTILVTARTKTDHIRARRDIISLRLVGYLLIHYSLFSPDARGPMQNAIASCNAHPDDVTRLKLCELGEFYLKHLIRPMKRSQDCTHAPTNHATRPSFDRRTDTIQESITPSSRRGDAKKKALARDGYCCMVTGRPDTNYLALHFDALMSVYGKRHSALTQCCHIIPFSISSFKGEREETFGYKLEGAAIFWGILKMFGYHLQPELNGNNINRLENVMTLGGDLHAWFDDMNIWLEEVEEKENTYRTCLPSRLERMRESLHIPPEVHFISHSIDIVDGSNHDSATSDAPALPDPRYLRLRAACCRVAHLSGAAEYLDEIYRDMDTIQVLAVDGSSAEVLDAALWRVTDLVAPV